LKRCGRKLGLKLAWQEKHKGKLSPDGKEACHTVQLQKISTVATTVIVTSTNLETGQYSVLCLTAQVAGICLSRQTLTFG